MKTGHFTLFFLLTISFSLFFFCLLNTKRTSAYPCYTGTWKERKKKQNRESKFSKPRFKQKRHAFDKSNQLNLSWNWLTIRCRSWYEYSGFRKLHLDRRAVGCSQMQSSFVSRKHHSAYRSFYNLYCWLRRLSCQRRNQNRFNDAFNDSLVLQRVSKLYQKTKLRKNWKNQIKPNQTKSE